MTRRGTQYSGKGSSWSRRLCVSSTGAGVTELISCTTAPTTDADHAGWVRAVSKLRDDRELTSRSLSYPHLVQRLGRGNIILLPELQEITNHPCDTGSSRAELEADAELEGLDFSGLDDDRHGARWPSKEGIFDHSKIKERTLWVRKWLRSRDEEVIVGELDRSQGRGLELSLLFTVVAHGDVLRILTGDRGEAVRYIELPVAVVADLALSTRSCFLLPRPSP